MTLLAQLERSMPQALSLDNPDDVQKLLDHFGAPSRSGINVNESTARQAWAVSSCVRIASEDVATVGVVLYRRLPGGGKERATDHWAYRLVHDRPNSLQTPFEFKATMQDAVELRGNAYAYKVRVRGEIRELIPIHPDRVQPELDNGKFAIQYRIGGEKYTSREIFHLRGIPTGTGLVGMTPVTAHREAIGAQLAMQNHQASLLRNGARTSGVVEVPKGYSSESLVRIREGIEAAISGENLFKILLLEDGMKFSEKLTMTNEDAQFLEMMRYSATQIAALWRIPPHMIGADSGSSLTYSNVESQVRSYLVSSLLPRLVQWEERLTLELLNEEERSDLFFEALPEERLRGLTQERFQAYQTALGGSGKRGWMSPNEVRVRENMNPVEGGDRIYGVDDEVA